MPYNKNLVQIKFQESRTKLLKGINLDHKILQLSFNKSSRKHLDKQGEDMILRHMTTSSSRGKVPSGKFHINPSLEQTH